MSLDWYRHVYTCTPGKLLRSSAPGEIQMREAPGRRWAIGIRTFSGATAAASWLVFLEWGWVLSFPPDPQAVPVAFRPKSRPAQGQSRPHANFPPHLQPLLHLRLLMFQTHQTPPSRMTSQSHPLPSLILFPCLCLSGAFASLVRILPSPSSYPKILPNGIISLMKLDLYI